MNSTRTALHALTVPAAVIALSLGLGAGAAHANTPVDDFAIDHPGDTDPEWPDPDPTPQVPQGPGDFAPGGSGPTEPTEGPGNFAPGGSGPTEPTEPPVEPGSEGGDPGVDGDDLPTRIDAGLAPADGGPVDLGWLLAGGGLLVASGAVAAQRVRRVA